MYEVNLNQGKRLKPLFKRVLLGFAVVIAFVVIVAFIVITISSASKAPDYVPEKQQIFVEKIESLQSEYRDAERSKNEALIDNTLSQSHTFFNTQRRVDNWVMTISSVKRSMGEEKYALYAHDYSGIEYHLYSDEVRFQDGFKQLTAGRTITISGVIKGEGSITKTGAIEEPEIMVTLDALQAGIL